MTNRRVRRFTAADGQAARQQQRAVVGRLSHALVQPRTLAVYSRTVHQFSAWLSSRGLVWSAAVHDTDFLDLLVAEWIEWLWTEGRPQGTGGSTLSAVQF